MKISDAPRGGPIDLTHVMGIQRRIKQIIATPSIMVAAVELQRLHDDITFMLKDPKEFAWAESELAYLNYHDTAGVDE